MEDVTKEQFETILARCKRSIQRVEDGLNKEIKEHEEEFHVRLYTKAASTLRFLFDISFDDEDNINTEELDDVIEFYTMRE